MIKRRVDSRSLSRHHSLFFPSRADDAGKYSASVCARKIACKFLNCIDSGNAAHRLDRVSPCDEIVPKAVSTDVPLWTKWLKTTKAMHREPGLPVSDAQIDVRGMECPDEDRQALVRASGERAASSN